MIRTAIVCGALALAAVSAPAQPRPIAITGVTVVPMDAERLLAGQTVLIANGRITALGSSSVVSPPPGAVVIDGGGLYLLPGLTDTHVHLRETEAETHLLLHLAHGVTTVQSLHGSPWHLELRRRVRDGELLGPRIVTTGPTTGTERVDSPEKADRFVAEQKAAGYDAIKMYGDGAGGMTEATYARVIAAAHAAGMRVTGHAPRNHPFSLVLEHGQDSIDHLEEILYTYEPITEVIGTLLDVQFGRAPPAAAEPLLADLDGLRARLQPTLARLARETRAAGLAIAPTLIAFRTIWQQTTADFPALLEMPQMRWMHPLTRAEWGPELNGYRGGWEDRMELVSRILKIGFDTQMAIVPHLQAAGVPILTGTDAPLEFVFPGWSLHRELELLVEAGLTPYEAMRAATVNPAEELGAGTESGTVAVGKRADLLLVEANPLDDVSAVGRVVGVVVGGRWLPRGELERRIEEATATYDALGAAVEPLMTAFAAGEAEAVADAWRRHGGDERVGRFAERLINSLGYRILNDGDARTAVATFRINTELFPETPNVWDSLGEGLMNAGAFEEALASYRKALELDPDFANPASYVEFLEEVVTAGSVASRQLSDEELGRYAGDYGERHVQLEEGGLVYFRGDGEPRRLVALGGDRFMIEGVGFFLMRFELDASGRAARIVGVYADGRTDESPRD